MRQTERGGTERTGQLGAFLLALALLLTAGLGLFLVKFLVSGESWASAGFNRHLYDSDGVLRAGEVLDRDGDPLSFVENGRRTYYADAGVREGFLYDQLNSGKL